MVGFIWGFALEPGKKEKGKIPSGQICLLCFAPKRGFPDSGVRGPSFTSKLRNGQGGFPKGLR